jgi:hypothetical protein
MSRITALRFDEGCGADLHGYNLGAQLGTTYLIGEGFAASLLVEQNSSRMNRFALGVFAMLDLAFVPDI